MQLTGEQKIAATRQRVWECLNDPEILKQCIPGCQSLEKTSEERFNAVVAIKIGPIGARFVGAVTLADLDPPSAYTITGEGQAGPAGFAKGSARVKLADDGDGTLLTYEVDAEVGGRMAQVGGAIIDATAKQLANTFFTRFRDVVAPPPDAPVSAAAAPIPGATPSGGAAPAPSTVPAAARGASQSVTPWLISVGVAALAGFLLGGSQVLAPSALWGLWAGVMIAVVAAVGFEFGRRAATPIVKLDSDAILRLLRDAQEKKS
jgi:carbon monoxide dehydrogenase subunit G